MTNDQDVNGGVHPATVPIAVYSAALDEIYALRREMAYQALATQADLEFKTFPKSRREVAEKRVETMRACARGEVRLIQEPRNSRAMRYALLDAGADETLTRHQWETQNGFVS